MSIRSIIEINHDALHDLTKDPERLIEFIKSLAWGIKPKDINGVRFLAQRHHSEKLKLTVE